MRQLLSWSQRPEMSAELEVVSTIGPHRVTPSNIYDSNKSNMISESLDSKFVLQTLARQISQACHMRTWQLRAPSQTSRARAHHVALPSTRRHASTRRKWTISPPAAPCSSSTISTPQGLTPPATLWAVALMALGAFASATRRPCKVDGARTVTLSTEHWCYYLASKVLNGSW